MVNLHDQKEYVIHIRSLKETLNHGLVLRKVHRVITFNQKGWLQPYIDMNTELRKKAKNYFEKHFYKLMKNQFLVKHGKSTEVTTRHTCNNSSKKELFSIGTKLSYNKLFF